MVAIAPSTESDDAVAKLCDEGTPFDRSELIAAAWIMLQVSGIGRGRYPDTAGIEVIDAAEFRRQNRRRYV